MLRLHPRTLAVTLAVTAGISGLAGPSASAAPAAGSACNLTATPDTPSRSEDRGCLQISSTLSAAPAVGRTATLDITVRAAKDLTGVNIDAELPPTLQWVQAPEGLTTGTRTSRAPHTRGTLHTAHVRRAVKAQQVLRYRGVVKAVAAGPTELAVHASAASVPDSQVADAVHLTIGSASSSFGIKADTRAAAVPAAATTTAPKASAPTGQACVTGHWTWTDKDGLSRPGAAWQVQALDMDGTAEQVLTTGVVLADGTYLLCFDNTDQDGTGQDVKVRFSSDADHWRVVTNSDVLYTYTSAVQTNVATGSTSTLDLTPGDAAQMRGAAAFDAVRRAWDWKPGSCWDQAGVCEAVVVHWQPDSTDGTYYCNGCGVRLTWQDPDAAATVVHETGHSVMDDVYDHHYPPTNCTSPHYITAGADPGCAWSEGFAEWFPATVLDDPFYRWASGASLDLENPGSDWQNGDGVEGRVAGALIDLTDSTNEGDDRVSEGPLPTWDVFQNLLPNNFAEYWAGRGTAGYDVGADALATIKWNTIDYTVDTNPACTAAYSMVNPYSGGWTADVKVTAGSSAVQRWKVTMTLPSGVTVANVWNGVRSGSTGTVTVTNAPYNGGLGAGASVTYGFQASGFASPQGVTFSCESICRAELI
jgi:hypothetical protein